LAVVAPGAGTVPVVDSHNGGVSIVVRSACGTETRDDRDTPVHYIVVNGGGASAAAHNTQSSANALRVDWGGSALQASFGVKPDDWVTDLLANASSQRTLAQKTGLTVRVKG